MEEMRTYGFLIHYCADVTLCYMTLLKGAENLNQARKLSCKWKKKKRKN
jgi:hypothetical protein